jgi:hypothetical protein
MTMEADGGVEVGKAAEKSGLRQVEDFPLPLVLDKRPTQEKGKWNRYKFRH